MKLKAGKQALNDAIQAMTDYKRRYYVRPGIDNTRNRKFPFKKMISSILALRGGTLNREIIDFFGLDPTVGTSSAFIQQRTKILPEAFESLFRYFINKIDEKNQILDFGCLLLTVLICRLLQTPTIRIPIFQAQTVRKPITCCISMRCMICCNIPT